MMEAPKLKFTVGKMQFGKVFRVSKGKGNSPFVGRAGEVLFFLHKGHVFYGWNEGPVMGSWGGTRGEGTVFGGEYSGFRVRFPYRIASSKNGSTWNQTLYVDPERVLPESRAASMTFGEIEQSLKAMGDAEVEVETVEYNEEESA